MKRNWLQIGIFVFVMLWADDVFGQAHTATYNISNTGCSTTTSCTAQIWRVVLPKNSTCPVVGDASYINVQPALPATTSTTTSQSWTYVDTGASLVSGGTYCGYATNSYVAGGGPSGASAIFQGQIPTPLTPPGAPTIAVTLK